MERRAYASYYREGRRETALGRRAAAVTRAANRAARRDSAIEFVLQRRDRGLQSARNVVSRRRQENAAELLSDVAQFRHLRRKIAQEARRYGYETRLSRALGARASRLKRVEAGLARRQIKERALARIGLNRASEAASNVRANAGVLRPPIAYARSRRA